MEETMEQRIHSLLPELLNILGLDEEPLGMFYTDDAPSAGFSPKPTDLPTREKEQQNAIDWQEVFGSFSCIMGHIRRARMKKSVAYFSAERFGCPGAAFWMGFNKPQTETIIHYVSTGMPGYMEGELYCDSPDELRRIFELADPRPAPMKICVVKPLSLFAENEQPELIMFFSRPESLCGLHQLAFFVTNDPQVVVSPWSSGCGSIAAWPQHYLNRGENRAVIGGWDPSARQFFKNDELSFTVPWPMFRSMLDRYKESFLTTDIWAKVGKKIARSKKSWGEDR
jgi:uncharacterized protein (DUF169 family)